MWTPWTSQRDSFSRTYDLLSSFRQQMDQALGELGGYRDRGDLRGYEAWPQLELDDRGEELVLTAEVPGLSEKDLQISATADALTVSGERNIEAPSGYSVHRRERPSYKFSQSVRFPVRIDVERITANVAHGILTVTMAKAEDARPRQIKIRKG